MTWFYIAGSTCICLKLSGFVESWEHTCCTVRKWNIPKPDNSYLKFNSSHNHSPGLITHRQIKIHCVLDNVPSVAKKNQSATSFEFNSHNNSPALIFSNYQWYTVIKCGSLSASAVIDFVVRTGGDKDGFLSVCSSLEAIDSQQYISVITRQQTAKVMLPVCSTVS